MNPALAIVLKQKLAASICTIEGHNREIYFRRHQALAALQYAKEVDDQLRSWYKSASPEEREHYGRLCDEHGFAVVDVLPEVP